MAKLRSYSFLFIAATVNVLHASSDGSGSDDALPTSAIPAPMELVAIARDHVTERTTADLEQLHSSYQKFSKIVERCSVPVGSKLRDKYSTVLQEHLWAIEAYHRYEPSVVEKDLEEFAEYAIVKNYMISQASFTLLSKLRGYNEASFNQIAEQLLAEEIEDMLDLQLNNPDIRQLMHGSLLSVENIVSRIVAELSQGRAQRPLRMGFLYLTGKAPELLRGYEKEIAAILTNYAAYSSDRQQLVQCNIPELSEVAFNSMLFFAMQNSSEGQEYLLDAIDRDLAKYQHVYNQLFEFHRENDMKYDLQYMWLRQIHSGQLAIFKSQFMNFFAIEDKDFGALPNNTITIRELINKTFEVAISRSERLDALRKLAKFIEVAQITTFAQLISPSIPQVINWRKNMLAFKDRFAPLNMRAHSFIQLLETDRAATLAMLPAATAEGILDPAFTEFIENIIIVTRTEKKHAYTYAAMRRLNEISQENSALDAPLEYREMEQIFFAAETPYYHLHTGFNKFVLSKDRRTIYAQHNCAYSNPIYAFSAVDGYVKWTYEVPEHIEPSILKIGDNLLMHYQNQIHVVDPNTGEGIRSINLDGYESIELVNSPVSHVVQIIASKQRGQSDLLGFDGDLSLLYEHPLPCGTFYKYRTAAGRLLHFAKSGAIEVFDENGIPFKVATLQPVSNKRSLDIEKEMNSIAAFGDLMYYVRKKDQSPINTFELACINLSAHREMWAYDIGQKELETPPSLSQDGSKIFLLTRDQKLSALSTDSRILLWQADIKGTIPSFSFGLDHILPAAGALYGMCGMTGDLCTFNMESGSVESVANIDLKKYMVGFNADEKLLIRHTNY